jgi:hypothetical protein
MAPSPARGRGPSSVTTASLASREGGAAARLPLGYESLVQTVPVVLVLFLGGVALAVVVAVRRGQARHRLQPAVAGPAEAWAQGATPAGWFADPSRRHELRSWDGHRWTEHVAGHGTQAVDPL